MMSLNEVVIAIAAAAATVPGTAAQPESPRSALDRLVQETRAEMMKPGPTIPGWNVGGADPEAALDSAGADSHVLLVEDGRDRHVEIRTDRRISDLAPPAWRPIDSYGSPVAFAEHPFVAFVPLGTGHAAGIRTHRWRENGLSCDKAPAHAILYEIPAAPKSNIDADAVIGMFRIVMMAMEGQTVCARAEGRREAGWRVRMLLPDGRDLPALNETETRVRIVPSAPIDRLVKGAPLEESEPTPAE